MRRRCILAILGLALCAPLRISAEWKIGLAKVVITPKEPIPMAGYASRREPFQGVDSDLYAKALALGDERGNRALLITADLLGFPNELAERICARLREETGIEREAVLLNGSHTHTGPLVSAKMLSGPAAVHAPGVRRYVEGLEDAIVAIGRSALESKRPGALWWGSGLARFVFNRREPAERGIRLGVNPRGLADRSVPVLRVESEDGALRAVVFGAAAHNTTLTGRHMRIGGDYSGYAQTALERRFPGIQAMFVTGCAGDASPVPRGELAMAREHGRELAGEVAAVLGGELELLHGPLRTLLRRVDLPLQSFTAEEIERMAQGAPSYRKFFTDRAAALLHDGRPLPATYNAPFALWQFGESLTLVAFSGETLVGYVPLTGERLGPLNLWIAGYSNDLYGYLPTMDVVAEGGYESRGLYMGVGLFAAEVEGVVMDAVEAMAREAGRLR